MTRIHDTDHCDCGMCRFAQNARQTISSLSRAGQGEKIDSSPSGGSGISIPVTETAFGSHLRRCAVCATVAGQFPDLELFDHQLCPEGRQVFRNPTQIPTPDFTREWGTAPRWATRTTEMEAAEWWLLRGIQIERSRALAVMNEDLREILRVGRERLTR